MTLDRLSFTYPGATQATLVDLDLHIEQGEAHALLGASGAGKTTLLNILSGLLVPTGGRVLFDAENVSTLPGRARNVAQVFQFPVLYESLNVAENLAFVLRNNGLPKATIAERLDYISAELGIQNLRDLKPRALSLYQKQLVAVGKALIRPDVSLVLLDEPLTAVEPKIKWQLRQTLRRAQQDLGVTMIYVTHDQTEALTFADRVSVLTDMGILQTGTPEEVYAEPAHEFVGHFVGSPGMNFVPAALMGVNNCDRLGFRPEWASFSAHAPLSGEVVRVRVQGTEDGEPYGLSTLHTEHGDVAVRGRMPPHKVAVGMHKSIRIHRYVAFQGQHKVGVGEFV